VTAVVAFDLGLHTTGVAWPGGSDIHVCPASLRRSPMTFERQVQRRHWWISTLSAILLPFPRCVVAVEAPITHAKNATGMIETHRMHGWLDVAAYRNDSTLVTVTPSELKKWATGSGSAGKDDMLAAAVARGCTEPQTHDEADAWLLRAMVVDSYRQATATTGGD
jgi:Holliday junction resolvasome RuvABC endonuclease subunit